MPKTREVIYGALLTALALLIPLAFGGYLGVFIPLFSATLASHVPLFLSMLVSPWLPSWLGRLGIGFSDQVGTDRRRSRRHPHHRRAGRSVIDPARHILARCFGSHRPPARPERSVGGITVWLPALVCTVGDWLRHPVAPHR